MPPDQVSFALALREDSKKLLLEQRLQEVLDDDDDLSYFKKLASE
jgi:hypothetical protein